jgi:tRNA U38,U39,U40 pseudouridine synthase TruA
MVDVARQRRPAPDIDALLHRDPSLETSPPAPASGLFLSRVYYDESELVRDGERNAEPAFVSMGGPLD